MFKKYLVTIVTILYCWVPLLHSVNSPIEFVSSIDGTRVAVSKKVALLSEQVSSARTSVITMDNTGHQIQAFAYLLNTLAEQCAKLFPDKEPSRATISEHEQELSDAMFIVIRGRNFDVNLALKLYVMSEQLQVSAIKNPLAVALVSLLENGDLLSKITGSNDQTWLGLMQVAHNYPIDYVLSMYPSIRKTFSEFSTHTTRHKFFLESIFSPDGSKVLTFSMDGAAKILDATDGRLIATIKIGGGLRAFGLFSEDGSKVITTLYDGTVNIVDATDGRTITTFKHGDDERLAIFSPDGSKVATSSEENNIARILDATDGTVIATIKHDTRLRYAIFSPDGSKVLTVSNGLLKFLDATDGSEVARFEESGLWIADYSPDGSRVVCISVRPDAAHIVNATNGKLIATIKHKGEVHGSTFSPDGTKVATYGWGGIKVVNLVDGREIASIDHDSWAYAPDFSPDSSKVVTASADKTAKIVDIASSKVIKSIKHTGIVWRAYFSPDGSKVATASSDGTAKIVDATDGSLIATIKHNGMVYSAVFSPDGSKVLTASKDGAAKLVDAADGKVLLVIRHSEGRWVDKAVFSPDGSKVLTKSQDGTAKITDIRYYQESKNTFMGMLLIAYLEKLRKSWQLPWQASKLSFFWSEVATSRDLKTERVPLFRRMWHELSKPWKSLLRKRYAAPPRKAHL